MKLTPEYVSLGPESTPRANVVTISKILPLTKFEPRNFGNGNTVNVQNPNCPDIGHLTLVHLVQFRPCISPKLLKTKTKKLDYFKYDTTLDHFYYFCFYLNIKQHS